MKSYNLVLIEKLRKYLLCHQTNLISMKILQVKKYYHQINKKIIEQATFTYSPLGKAFEKQIKAIEDQREKQIKAIKNRGQVTKILKYAYDDKDIPLIAKQNEIFNELLDERLDEITKLDKKRQP